MLSYVSRPWNLTVVVLPLALSGCLPAFSYMPNAPLADKPQFREPVYVRGFEDKTASPFLSRDKGYNMAVGGSYNVATPHIPPAELGRDFVRELEASGLFPKVEYVDSGGARLKRGILVTGDVERLHWGQGRAFGGTGRGVGVYLLFHLRATSIADGGLVFAKSYRRDRVKITGSLFGHKAAEIASLIRTVFGEMTRDLAAALREERGGKGPGSPADGTPDSVEDILRRIGEEE